MTYKRCEECGKRKARAYLNSKKVCKLCFDRLKPSSKTRGRPLVMAFWKRWLEMSEGR